MIALVTGSIERYLNALLEESTAARERLAELDGASLGVELTVPGIELVVRADGVGLHISREPIETADVALSGAPLALLALWRSGRTSDFSAHGVEIRGDTETLEAFVGLMKLLLPDLEELLAPALGDIGAHELVRAGRAARAWTARTGEALLMNTAEYLQEESRDLPARAEAEALFEEIEKLRDDVARAVARAEHLLGTAGATEKRS